MLPDQCSADSLPDRTSGLRIRQAVRALLLSPDHEVLLVRFEFPTRQVWALPGGGIEPGEDHLTALRRELIEETGLHDPEIGAHIWTREHVIPFVDGSFDGQRDRIHLVRTARFDPVPGIGWDQMRAERVHEMRWWSLAEINRDQTDPNSVGFAPAAFPALLRALIDNGQPSVPTATGI